MPILSQHLSLPISTPLAKGEPSINYPYPWSVYKWLEGETLIQEVIEDKVQLAKDLGRFLVELQSIQCSGGPIAGDHNFYRGGNLAVYDKETRNAIKNNTDIFHESILEEIWALALESQWELEPVWIHGDIAPGNLLVKEGRLSAVIDFGILGIGDPSCDAAMAWTFFDVHSRKVFKNELKMDNQTWNRARGWALWKALITYDGHKKCNNLIVQESFTTIKKVIEDFQQNVK